MDTSRILAVDIGTSIVRCHIYDDKGRIVASARRQNKLLYPHPGWVELDPDVLWTNVVEVIREAILTSEILPSDLTCMGISTMRNAFITWDKISGEPYHKFISWNDLRADHLVKSWDSSFSMRGIRFGAKLLYSLTGRTRYLAASVLKLANRQISMRLLWALDNIPKLRQDALDGKALFGTIDTWILWKLTGGKVHATDYSCASSTALYDPFLLEWGRWAFNLFKIPFNLMPEVKDTSGYFGDCCAELFGASIPIMAMAGDQQAATFGQCCFEAGDVKCTMGTGSFIDINTGVKPHASVNGLYPLIGWKYGSTIVYLAEGSSNDTGTAILWAQSIGILDDPVDSSDIAQSVENSGGVFFIPGFSGLQAPINDDFASAGLIGITPSTSKAQLVRAVLESLAYRINQLYKVIEKEANFSLTDIRANGGVSSNDFVLQLISNLTNKKIYRPRHTDMSCLGIAFLAGLASGVWKSKDELKALVAEERIFEPQLMTDEQKAAATEWDRAVTRFLHWYTP